MIVNKKDRPKAAFLLFWKYIHDVYRIHLRGCFQDFNSLLQFFNIFLLEKVELDDGS